MKKTINYLFVCVGVTIMQIFGGCSKSNDALPAIDGYNSSADVGKANLVAHWTFDDTNKEVISNTAPTTTLGTVGFTTGVLGKALQLTKGSMVYPTIANINTVDALNNFTVSLWVNTVNQKGVVGGGFQSFFGIIPTATDFWGNIQACAETGWHLPSSDTLALKNYLNVAGVGQDNVATFNSDPADGAHPNGQTGAYFYGAKKWSHYVMTWEGSTGMFYMYANGVSVGGYTNRGTSTGVMKLAVPVMAVFGSMASSDLGFPNATRPSWSPMATASIDDVRVFNTVLAQKDVTALYDLGLAGR